MTSNDSTLVKHSIHLGIAEMGKPVSGFAIEQSGDIATIASASRKAQEYVQWASERQREECGISDLWLSVKCGESDTTSGLASNPTVGNAIDKLEYLRRLAHHRPLPFGNQIGVESGSIDAAVESSFITVSLRQYGGRTRIYLSRRFAISGVGNHYVVVLGKR